jgi:hypothetical protein
MSLETAQFINQLNILNPDGTDLVSTADDHLRLIKSTIKNTFPNITGPVTASQDALNGQSYLIDTGSANAVVVTPAPAWTSYTDGRSFTFKAVANSTSITPTINVSNLGVKALVTADGNPAVLFSNSIYEVVYNGTAFVLKNSTIKAIITNSITIQPATLDGTSIISTGSLNLGSNSTNRIAIAADGKIGIGLEPTTFDVDILASTLRLQNTTTECNIVIGPQTNTGTIFGNSTQIGLNSNTSGCKLSVGKTATSDIDFFTPASTAPTLSVKRSGKVTLGGTFGSATAKLNIAATDTPTAGYAELIELRNDSVGAANISKYIRLSSTGTLEIRNAANNNTIFSLTDGGVLTLDVAGGGGMAADSIATGTFPLGVNAVTAAINDSSYKIATTMFCNRNSSISTSPTGYNFYTAPSGHTWLWSNVTVNANATVKITLHNISSTFSGKTIVSLMNTVQSLTGNTQDYYEIKMKIGTDADAGSFSIINTTGVATPVFYQVILV